MATSPRDIEDVGGTWCSQREDELSKGELLDCQELCLDMTPHPTDEPTLESLRETTVHSLEDALSVLRDETRPPKVIDLYLIRPITRLPWCGLTRCATSKKEIDLLL